MYSCSIGNAPVYLSELLTEKPVGRLGLGSAIHESFILYDVSFYTKATFSDRGFIPAEPKLWNDLPSSLKRSKSLDVLKKSVSHIILVSFIIHFKVNR